MADEEKPHAPTRDEIAFLTMAPLYECMERHGIDADYLIKKLKRELNAKESKTAKLKGAVNEKALRRSRHVVATSGSLGYDKDGQIFGDGDVLIEWDDISWGVRQKARQDAHKLLGHYPAERMEHTGKDGAPIEHVIIEVIRPQEKNNE